MHIAIYPPEKQGTGEFDNGKLIEQRPINFSREYTAVDRVGSIFYWAWFYTKDGADLPLHPHQGFEIMSYIIHGAAEHGDTLGSGSIVTAGGAQVMQTGSGVSHEERFIEPETEGFQIWFEPNILEAYRRKPLYDQYDNEDFAVEESSGYIVKTILGEGSRVELETDVSMWDIEVRPGQEYRRIIPANHSIALLAIRGAGTITTAIDVAAVQHRDFVVMSTDEEQEVVVWHAHLDDPVRIVMIQVPNEVKYRFLKK